MAIVQLSQDAILGIADAIGHQNVAVRAPKRPAAPSLTSDRAQARMIRQKIIEQEQEIEDHEALRAIKVSTFRAISSIRDVQYRAARAIILCFTRTSRT